MDDSVEPILYDASSAPLAKVVLVHGALDRSMAFRGVLQRLYEYDVTVYDRRGYGAAVGLSPAMSIDDHVADLIAVLDAAALNELPSVVVGHSMGGAIAMLAAASRPDLVQSLGVFEPPLPGITLPTDDSPTSADIPEDPEHLVRWMYRRVVGESAFERMDPRAQRALVEEAPALRADLDSVRDVAQPFNPTALTVPTVVGYGGDSVPRHIARAEWLAEQIPNATLFETPDAQHACHRSHPELFAKFVIQAAGRNGV
jgi:pimeloyl-ACP methyl ester carboxylesterase